MAQALPQTLPLWKKIRHELPQDITPRDAATHVLHRLNIEAPPVLIEGIAKQLDVRVIKKPHHEYAGEVNPQSSPATIIVRGSDHGVRQRFTIAHELGHLLFDKLTTQHRDTFFANPRTLAEIRANDFAASLLVPLWMLESMAMSKPRTTAQLSEIFEVSIPVMNHQLRKIMFF